jgi:hypothetical protein
VRLFRRVVAIVAIFGGAVSAASCASFGASSEPTPTAPADSGPAAAEGGSEAGAIGDGGAPPDAQPGAPLQCPTNVLVCDAFEDRGGSTTDLAGTRWEPPLSGPAFGRIDDTMSFSPAHSLAIDVPKGTSGATLGIQALPKAMSRTSVTLRAAIRVSVLPQYAQIISMVADAAFFSLVLNAGKVVAQYGDGTAGGAYVPTATDFPVGRWFRFAFVVTFGPSGGVELLIDDASIYKASAKTTPAPTVGDLRLIVQPNFGSAGTATTEPITIHYDDIVLE